MSSASDLKRLRNAFVICLIVGGLGIVAGWVVEDWAGQAVAFTLTLGFPLSVMAAYIYAGYRMDKANMNTDAFADSVYYMGFLFTLVALVFSLMAITGSGTTTAGLVLRFGVALSTTIVGLGVRTVLTNFRPSAKDELAKLEHEIEEAAYGLRDRYVYLTDTVTLHTKGFEAALTKATGDLNTASTEIEASGRRLKTSSDHAATELTGAIDDLVSSLKESSKEGTEDLVKDLRRIASSFQTTSHEASKTVESETQSAESAITSAANQFRAQTTSSLKKMEAGIDAASRDLGTAAETLKVKIETVDLPDDAFTKKLNPALQSLVSSIEAFRSDLDVSIEEIPKTQPPVEALVATLQSANSGLSTLTEKTSEYVKAIEQMKRQVEADATLAERHREQLQQAVTDSREALSSIYGELVAAAKILEEKVAVE